MEPQLPFSSMLGMAAETTPQQNVLAPGMESMTNPEIASPLAMMHQPVQTPAELEARVSGWKMLQEKLSDPNLLRSLGFASAAMMMPGSSPGHGLAAGLTAFQAGEYANQAKERSDQEFALKQMESQANIGATRAQTDLTQARTPGVAAESNVAVRTEADRVARAKTERETADLALKNATSESEVATVERAIRARKAEVERDIPDAARRRAALADLEASELRVKEARERIKKTAEETALGKVKRETAEKELAAIKDMTPEDLRAFMTKSGKYSGTTSAYVQQANLWGTLYDKLPDTDPHRKGKTREQFIQSRLTEAKQKDALELLVKAKQAGFSDEEIESLGLLDMARDAARQRRPGAADPKDKGVIKLEIGSDGRLHPQGTVIPTPSPSPVPRPQGLSEILDERENTPEKRAERKRRQEEAEEAERVRQAQYGSAEL